MQKPHKLVFIAGFFRSGSTWLGKLLDSHPNVIYRHEPLGRLQGRIINEKFMQAIKFNHGLTEMEREKLIKSIITAHPEVDRPPFFPKEHDWMPVFPRFLFWAVANKLKIINYPYRRFVTPRIQENNVLVVKETGWSIHLESIMDAFRSDLTCFLIRHPCAVLASIIRGLRLGLMDVHDRDTRILFVRERAKEKCVLETGVDEKAIIDMDDYEYYALRWRAYYEICLRYRKESRNKTKLIVYEDFQKRPEEIVRNIFFELKLSFEKCTKDFLKKSANLSFSSLGIFQKDSKNDYYSVYRKDNHHVNKWEKELTHNQIIRIKKITDNCNLSELWRDSQ